MERVSSAPALDICDCNPNEDCPVPSPDAQEECDHGSLDGGAYLERSLSSHLPVRAVRSLSIAMALRGC